MSPSPKGLGKGPHYKVRLDSGRVLGPLDLDRVRKLVKKGAIKGDETAREYPDGEWKEIALIPALAQVFVDVGKERIEASRVGTSPLKQAGEPSAISPRLQPTRVGPVGPTEILPQQTRLLPGAESPTVALSEATETSQASIQTETEEGTVALEGSQTGESTQVSLVDGTSARMMERAPEERVYDGFSKPIQIPENDELAKRRARAKEGGGAPRAMVVRSDQLMPVAMNAPREIANEATVMFQTPALPGVSGIPGRKRAGKWEILKATIAAFALGMVLYDLVLSEPEHSAPTRLKPIRPILPDPISGPANPEMSAKLYRAAMKEYVADNVMGYRVAAELLRKAASTDTDNGRALAMLASSYLNLIDSSNKDENYFSVISKLIDLTRAKQQDLPEAVIADVEFYLSANKPEAAQSRIVEYTKSHPTLQVELYYYLALAFYHRGTYRNASRYLQEIPDNKAFSPKIHYLRGQIAEKLLDTDAALKEYTKALGMSKNHVKSRLRIAEIFYRRGKVKEVAQHLEFVISHPTLLSPKDLALGYFLHSQLATVFGKTDLALGDMERATKLDKDNHDYLLELYSLRAKAGDKIKNFKEEARMYYFLSEGEKLLQQGKQHEALTQFLQARQAHDSSPLPLVKIGDMFRHFNDMANARLNYKMAADRAAMSIEVWSKYIQILIQSYEWEDAYKAMERFRRLPVPQSAIDKAAGDLFAKQGLYAEALTLYKKAMARDTIDPDVYIAYAKTLVAAKQYKDAPFFFALALRFDPSNIDALIGTAKCIAATESIDRGIHLLQDELQKNNAPKAELLSAVAEFLVQQGSWDEAEKYVEQARAANPDYAYPWKLQAQIYLNKADSDKDALTKALDAYQSYSDRNPGDPSGYLERYSIYVKKVEYDKASDELSKVFAIYPRYPNLHYYKGLLYAAMLNHKTAIEELRLELRNNPRNIRAMIALGKELVDRGQPAEGLVYLNDAMVAEPKSGDAKFQAGYANFMMKNFQGAIALYQAALIYDPGNPQIYCRLAQAYRAINEPGNVQTACRKYLGLEPNGTCQEECARYR